MKILFYSSTNAGFVNNYNIGKVISSYPDAEFAFVNVISKKKVPPSLKTSIINALKKEYFHLKNGRNLLARDNDKLASSFNNKTAKPPSNISTTLVDKVNDAKSEDTIKAFAPDIIIQCGAGILKANTFDQASIATLNVHHGFAPEVRGMHSTLWCLYYGLTDLIGVTCHIIDEHLDTGNIITQYHHPYNEKESYLEIQSTLIEQGANLLVEAIEKISKPHSFETRETDSYYFSHFDFLKYNELLKNEFKEIKSAKKLKTKKKSRTILKE